MSVVLLVGCASASQSNLAQLDPLIFQEWRHSYEEDDKDLKVYRLASFEFPLGWGRTGMKFEEDGRFLLYDIGANDAMIQVIGNWKQLSTKKLEISFPAGERETYTIDIEQLKSDMLKIKK